MLFRPLVVRFVRSSYGKTYSSFESPRVNLDTVTVDTEAC